jgi:tellurite resistance protein
MSIPSDIITKAAVERESWLMHFPVVLFATVMGVAGVTLVWQRGATLLDLPVLPGRVLAFVSVALYALLLAIYLTKLLRYPRAVRAEFRHPVRLAFFPALSIGMLLSATVLVHVYPPVSFWLWSLGALAQLAFILVVLSLWIGQTHWEPTHINPAWFIPIVGNVVVPLAGVEHGELEISWFFFSVGIVFWLVLKSIMFYRFFFHHPLPERLLPTLAILLAPPAVGFLAYMQLNHGALDGVARVLYYMAVFTFLLLLGQVVRWWRLRFFLSWWAYSFPLAAFTVATGVMAVRLDSPLLAGAALGLTGLCSLLVLLLVGLTVRAMVQGQVFVAES